MTWKKVTKDGVKGPRPPRRHGPPKIRGNALSDYLRRIPGLELSFVSEPGEEPWRIGFSIVITHPLAWDVVQHLAWVLNNLSLQEKLPVRFMPMSAPPYLNGGPRHHLWWVLFSIAPAVDPAEIARVLEDSLPSPVEDVAAWRFVPDPEDPFDDEQV